MGALLSLPLMAVPSVGSVSRPLAGCLASIHLTVADHDYGSFMLRSSDLLRRMQCMR